MKAFLDSFLIVLASEMGDKTQLLTLMLAIRYRRPWTILGGILIACLISHGIASAFGGWISQQISPNHLRWILACSFWAFALWVLVPDKESELKDNSRFGVFTTTIFSFLLAEMGDKTQLATVALGAKFQDPVIVTLGTTAGMLVSDGLVVFLGERFLRKVPMKWVRVSASVLFAIFGLAVAWES
jgi:putative Ca2+/H+ antiporter (TMEM165/GDT1 family)